MEASTRDIADAIADAIPNPYEATTAAELFAALDAQEYHEEWYA